MSFQTADGRRRMGDGRRQTADGRWPTCSGVLTAVFLFLGLLQPAALRAQAAADSTSTFDVGGIRVIHRPAGGDMVVANLYLLGGVRQVTWENAGIELLMLAASENGTRTYSRERLRRLMTRLGTGISIDAETDWSSIGVRATRATFDSTWAVMASRVVEPTFDPGELEVVRQQFLLAVKQRQDSPDALAEFLADSLAYDGHPYAVPPSGTATSVASITQAGLKAYHTQQVVKSRMLVVVVGNVTRDKITRLVSSTLGKLPAGTYTWSLPDTLPRRRAAAYGLQRDLPTNFILGRYAGPHASTKDAYALRIATAILSGQFFGEVRSRRNLTYAVDAPYIDRAVSGGGVYVSTVSPQVTIDVMRQQLAAVRTSTVNPEALNKLIQQFITQFFLENETLGAQADFLAKSFLFEGDLQAAGHLEAMLRSITPADIQRVAQRWIKDVQWAYIGDVSKLPKASMERW
ncbi:MAG: insulinase family protein [Gemmatimonadetes bacterium]|nr:insulinase family protein [Gemmatimonadota bacterium]